MRKLIVLAILSLASSARAEDVPGRALLSYFQANCGSQGEWTAAALADSSALVETLRSLNSDPDCKSIGGAVAGLNLLGNQVTALQNVTANQEEISRLDGQEQEIMVQLSQTSDAAVQASLNSTLRDLQVTRSGLMGKDRFYKDLTAPGKAQLMTAMIQTANTTFTQLAANQKCLDKNPSIVNTATSILSTVGSAAVFVNPALGLGITAGSAFMGNTIDALRVGRNNREIRALADNTMAMQGYKCALEVMSDHWCQMRDAEVFLNFKANQRRPESTDLSAAIRLNDREIPVLLEWLGKIKSGVTPTNSAEASRQNEIIGREALVRSVDGSGRASITERRSLYSASSGDERWNVVKTIVNRLVRIASGGAEGQYSSGPRSPFTDVLAIEYAPFFLLGFAESDPVIRNPALGGAFYDLSSWERPATFEPSLEVIQDRFADWVDRARSRVNLELADVLQPDTLQTLSSAYERTGNAWKLSPMDSLKNLITFLDRHRPQEADQAFKRIFEETLTTLRGIYDVTETYVVMNQLKERTPVDEIYQLARLQYGTVVIQTRLDMIVRLTLFEYLQNSTPQDQVLVAQLLAADRFTQALSKMSGREDLGLIRQDIQSAQPATISNLNGFIQIFGKNINKLLGQLKAEEERAQPTVARAKRNARTQLCFLLLSVPDARYNIYTGYCDGLKMEPLIQGGPESIKLTADTFRKDLNDRACEYREFFRKSKIYENWGIKP